MYCQYISGQFSRFLLSSENCVPIVTHAARPRRLSALVLHVEESSILNPRTRRSTKVWRLRSVARGRTQKSKRTRISSFITPPGACRRHESVTCPSRIRPEPQFHHPRPHRTRGRTGVTAGTLREAPPYPNITSAEPKPSSTRLKPATKRGWDSPI